MCFTKKLNDKLGKLSPATKAVVGDAFVTPEDTSAKDAAAAEAARQQRISANVAAINDAYAGRESQYQQYADAIRTKNTAELGRQQATANRQLKFALAGSGLTGGSYAADAGRELGREAAQGAITAEQKVNDATSALRSADENARLQMISLAQTGSDIGNASNQTANMLKANLQNAQGSTAGELGDVFGSTAATYKAMQEARNLRRGLTTSYENIYGSALGAPTAGTR